MPLGFSGMQANGQSADINQTNASTNQTDITTNQTLTNSTLAGSNQTGTTSNQTGTTSNQTGTTSNQTSINVVNSTATENIGQQISNFVHNATSLFQQQRNETIQAIQDCHQKMRTATSDNRTQIIDECHATLDAIKVKYQDARNQFQELFKQFRESIITLRHQAEGLHVSEQDRANALRNINEDAAKHGMTGINMALEHMKGMGENGMTGIERALQHVNETNESNRSGTTSTQVMPHTPTMPPNPSASHGGMQGIPTSPTTTTAVPVIPPMQVQPPNEGLHGPPISPGQSGSHGKH